MLVTLSPMIYSVTCEPNISPMLESWVYVFPTIEFDFKVTEVRDEQS